MIRTRGSLALLLWVGLLATAHATPPGHALATAHPAATAAGLEILNAGGNAFDAAIAVSATLGVVEPYSAGLGGGGFFLLHDHNQQHTVMLDARERAPLAAHRDLFLDSQGNVDRNLALNGPLAAGIPGIAAAWAHLSEHYGRLSLDQTLAAAIHHARVGVPNNPEMAQAIAARKSILQRYPASHLFLADAPDAVLVQADLADTLTRLARDGAQAFYHGVLAEQLVAGVTAGDGIWTLEDLKTYQVVERAPMYLSWRGAEIYSASLPSASGIMLAQILRMLGEDWIEQAEEPARTHRLIEALRRAYVERATYLGDPDQVEVPTGWLQSAEHATELMHNFDPNQATPTARLNSPTKESSHTTHFSILDGDGNWVSATLSINGPFGSGFVAPGTGVLLNNEMDDFSAKPGAANLFGLVGATANAIAPGKRMLSSMAPTAVWHDERLALLGSPGGSRITTTVLQGLLDFLQGADATAMASRKRLHHQALPDQVWIEAGPRPTTEPLEDLGHTVVTADAWGNMQVVVWDRANKTLQAASDPRGVGRAAVELRAAD